MEAPGVANGLLASRQAPRCPEPGQATRGPCMGGNAPRPEARPLAPLFGVPAGTPSSTDAA